MAGGLGLPVGKAGVLGLLVEKAGVLGLVSGRLSVVRNLGLEDQRTANRVLPSHLVLPLRD